MAKLYGADRIGGAPSSINQSGGARRDRTDDLMLAKHALSQLSYGPLVCATRETTIFPSLRRRREHPSAWLSRHQARRPVGLAALRAARIASEANQDGGPGKTRTSDLTLIKRAL